MKVALTVTKPTANTCLRCHQHNLGGDIYINALGYTEDEISSLHINPME